MCSVNRGRSMVKDWGKWPAWGGGSLSGGGAQAGGSDWEFGDCGVV